MKTAQATGVWPLNIGDPIPDLRCANVLNYAYPSINIAKYKGRLVILDFMLTTCSSCMENLSRFKELQNKFAGKIQFIVVTGQNIVTVQRFLQKSPAGKQLDFPVITTDTKLKELFPHHYFSHLVWIGADQTVKAITHGEYVTAANIQTILDGRSNNWPVKKDIPDFDYAMPFGVLNEQVKNMQSQAALSSSFMRYLPEIGQYAIVQKDSIRQTIRTAFYNQPITEMYLRLEKKYRFPHSQMLFRVKDSSRYIFNESKNFRREWEQDNTYCYEAVLPIAMSTREQHVRIVNDLNFYFGINACIRDTILPSLVLKRSAVRYNPSQVTGDSLTLWAIINQLNMQYSGIPVFNELSEKTKTWIVISREQVKDRAMLQHILFGYGLELVTEMRKVEVLLVTEPLFYNDQNKQ